MGNARARARKRDRFRELPGQGTRARLLCEKAKKSTAMSPTQPSTRKNSLLGQGTGACLLSEQAQQSNVISPSRPSTSKRSRVRFLTVEELSAFTNRRTRSKTISELPNSNVNQANTSGDGQSSVEARKVQSEEKCDLDDFHVDISAPSDPPGQLNPLSTTPIPSNVPPEQLNPPSTTAIPSAQPKSNSHIRKPCGCDSQSPFPHACPPGYKVVKEKQIVRLLTAGATAIEGCLEGDISMVKHILYDMVRDLTKL